MEVSNSKSQFETYKPKHPADSRENESKRVKTIKASFTQANFQIQDLQTARNSLQMQLDDYESKLKAQANAFEAKSKRLEDEAKI